MDLSSFCCQSITTISNTLCIVLTTASTTSFSSKSYFSSNFFTFDLSTLNKIIPSHMFNHHVGLDSHDIMFERVKNIIHHGVRLGIYYLLGCVNILEWNFTLRQMWPLGVPTVEISLYMSWISHCLSVFLLYLTYSPTLTEILKSTYHFESRTHNGRAWKAHDLGMDESCLGSSWARNGWAHGLGTDEFKMDLARHKFML